MVNKAILSHHISLPPNWQRVAITHSSEQLDLEGMRGDILGQNRVDKQEGQNLLHTTSAVFGLALLR